MFSFWKMAILWLVGVAISLGMTLGLIYLAVKIVKAVWSGG
jgi:hypothetical protein